MPRWGYQSSLLKETHCNGCLTSSFHNQWRRFPVLLYQNQHCYHLCFLIFGHCNAWVMEFCYSLNLLYLGKHGPWVFLPLCISLSKPSLVSLVWFLTELLAFLLLSVLLYYLQICGISPSSNKCFPYVFSKSEGFLSISESEKVQF